MTGLSTDDEQRRKSAEWALEIAKPDTITAAVKRMQVMKGRTYSEVAMRMYGQELDENGLTHIERAICEMMASRLMTTADLAKWYAFALETAFDGDKFTPLPNYTDCVKLVEKAQIATFRLRDAANAVLNRSPVADRVRQIAAVSSARTMPELFDELKSKLDTP